MALFPKQWWVKMIKVRRCVRNNRTVISLEQKTNVTQIRIFSLMLMFYKYIFIITELLLLILQGRKREFKFENYLTSNYFPLK